MSEESFYNVVLGSQDAFDLQKLADALSRASGMVRLDALSHIRSHWGILYRTKEMEKAQDLRQKLEQEGVETFILDNMQLKAILPPKLLKKVIPKPEGLVLEENEREKILPWDNFILICSGQVEVSIMVKKKSSADEGAARKIASLAVFLTTGIPVSAKNTKPEEEVKKETSSNYYLDIIAKENAESLSISGYSFDYSYLGNRKQYNIFANFSNLVKDTAGFLPNAVRNRGVRSLEQGGGTFRDFRYRSIEEYEAEKLWLLQLLKK